VLPIVFDLRAQGHTVMESRPQCLTFVLKDIPSCRVDHSVRPSCSRTSRLCRLRYALNCKWQMMAKEHGQRWFVVYLILNLDVGIAIIT